MTKCRFFQFFIGGFLLLLVLVLYNGCILPLIMVNFPITFTTEAFEAIGEVDQLWVEVAEWSVEGKVEGFSVYEIIDDPERIQAIIRKLSTYDDNWQNKGFHEYSLTNGTVHLRFYQDGKAKITFGIGRVDGVAFLSYSNEGRYLTEEEFEELMDFLEIDETFVFEEVW